MAVRFARSRSRRRWASTCPGDERDPTWSPDGASLAYVAISGTEKIQLVSLRGGTPRVLTAEGTSNEAPAFSHDGKRIAFSSNRSAKPESAYTAEVRKQPGSESLPVTSAHDIYVVDVGGRGLTRLTYDASANYSPAWSPDDRHIAFISDRDGRQELYVMGADGTNPVRLSSRRVMPARRCGRAESTETAGRRTRPTFAVRTMSILLASTVS